jgi:hypothetical protein
MPFVPLQLGKKLLHYSQRPTDNHSQMVSQRREISSRTWEFQSPLGAGDDRPSRSERSEIFSYISEKSRAPIRAVFTFWSMQYVIMSFIIQYGSPMMDAELRGRLLKHFYGLRHTSFKLARHYIEGCARRTSGLGSCRRLP